MTKRKWSPTGFGERLKAIREASGKSQQHLAEAVGVDVMTVSRLERGGQEPAWPLALAIAKALGVSCEAFEKSDSGEAAPPASTDTPAAKKTPSPKNAVAAPSGQPKAVPARKPCAKKGGAV